MRIFIIGLIVLVVIVILYFIWADYKSRKETETITQQSIPYQGSGTPKKNSALDWVSALIPVISGTIDTILSKPKPEEEASVDELSPSYEDLIDQGGLDYPTYG